MRTRSLPAVSAVIVLLSLGFHSAARGANLLFGDEFNARPTSSNYDFGFWWGDSYGPDSPESQFRLDYAQVQVNNGVLQLVAQKSAGRDQWNVSRPYVSGHLSTEGHFSAASYYVEVSAKLPHAQGAWPALWTLPANHNDGLAEVDAIEYVGPASGGDVTVAWHGGGVHAANDFDPGFDPSSGFHRYGVWSRAGRLEWYIDGKHVHTYANAVIPGNVQQYFMLTLQVGGDWPGTATFQQQVMEVDYLRVFDTLPAAPTPEPTGALALVACALPICLRRNR
jgi:beta-glucanase (GH16 family)